MQPGRRTVCGELTSALSTVLRQDVTLVVAGRTDAGVHASGQVAHLDVPAELWGEHEERLLRRLAAVLPGDVRVWSAAPAPAGFDARFAAKGRRYAYRVTDVRLWAASAAPERRHVASAGVGSRADERGGGRAARGA